MSEFVLIILVTMGLGKEPSTFEIRLPKETYKKCIKAVSYTHLTLPTICSV